jgi:hypothetical protein
MADAIQRLLESRGDRKAIGDPAELRDALDRVAAYQDFQPHRPLARSQSPAPCALAASRGAAVIIRVQVGVVTEDSGEETSQIASVERDGSKTGNAGADAGRGESDSQRYPADADPATNLQLLSAVAAMSRLRPAAPQQGPSRPLASATAASIRSISG